MLINHILIPNEIFINQLNFFSTPPSCLSSSSCLLPTRLSSSSCLSYTLLSPTHLFHYISSSCLLSTGSLSPTIFILLKLRLELIPNNFLHVNSTSSKVVVVVNQNHYFVFVFSCFFFFLIFFN